ncbi:MAG: DEAD/DEAH box helicase family protein, partial [Candidatus Dadabacteria bacterium]|nr:DEAD/DEAH box helicase family protein [Candidatus Dadabacteria bacterium]
MSAGFLSKCRSWEQFVAHAGELETSKQKGDLFEELVRLYLSTCPEYKTQLSDVWLLAGVPRNVARKLNLPKADEGIDLIAKTRSGHFWAIQAKYRSDGKTALNTRDLAKFSQLSFAYCKNINFGVVAHTTDKPVRKKELLGNVAEIGLSRWLELTADDWAAIRAHAKGGKHKPAKLKPKPHQEAALKKIRGHYLKEEKSRGRMIMPCGSGKSLTAFWAAEAIGARTVVLAVPSLILIKQGVRDWMREYVARGKTPDWLCVCSDETVGKGADSFVSSVYETGIPATTDTAEIAAFLKKRSSVPKVVFTTYQSSPRLAAAAKKTGRTIDLCILDEAHKTVGQKGSAFATLLDDGKMKIKTRLFMTATERVLHGRNEEVLSMDDERIYGPCFYQLTFKEAIEGNVICDYEILTLLITDAEIREIVGGNKLVRDRLSEGEIHESAPLAAGVALGRVFKERKIRHAVSFHRSIKAADDFRVQQDEISQSGVIQKEIENFHISSALSTGERTEIMRDFENAKRSLITNARCLSEGVDVPAIDCVLFADPKQSVVDIVQAAGRAMRKAEGKKKGYILLPIVVPEGLSFEEFAKSTAFKKVASQITALSTQDERIKDYFRAVTEGRRHRKGKIISMSGDVPVGMRISFDEFAKAVETEVWRKAAKVNWREFEEAREYVRGLNFKNQGEWYNHTKISVFPEDIPRSPYQVYKDRGWVGWGDWLGTGNIAPSQREYRSFGEAREYARSLNLKNQSGWVRHTRITDFPDDIPVNPDRTYKGKGWISMGDWLGTGMVATQQREYRPFEEARQYVRSLGLKNAKEWFKYTKTSDFPKDIPVAVNRIYKGKGWVSMGDWLGTGTIASHLIQYRSFQEAREYVRSLNLKSSAGWRKYTKTTGFPHDIPTDPAQAYRDKGWVGFGDWLGTGNIAPSQREYCSFGEAREYARSLRLRSFKEWRRHTKTSDFPDYIPVSPHETYKDKGWVSTGDWLGTGTVANYKREYRSFEEARKYARSLRLKGKAEWDKHTKTSDFPEDITVHPDRSYKGKGWVNWGDYLGTGTV